MMDIHCPPICFLLDTLSIEGLQQAPAPNSKIGQTVPLPTGGRDLASPSFMPDIISGAVLGEQISQVTRKKVVYDTRLSVNTLPRINKIE